MTYGKGRKEKAGWRKMGVMKERRMIDVDSMGGDGCGKGWEGEIEWNGNERGWNGRWNKE